MRQNVVRDSRRGQPYIFKGEVFCDDATPSICAKADRVCLFHLYPCWLQVLRRPGAVLIRAIESTGELRPNRCVLRGPVASPLFPPPEHARVWLPAAHPAFPPPPDL